ncbi:Panacea domain-containing protein [Clavibacter michiganensis]|uniref:Panacea domain-containing protein n=1 Tax=Clavibacter michiganensis TaxID=28447 RepID=UPI0029302A29|nr:Panacea domain-containing protein [Clavibacter michiganensis]
MGSVKDVMGYICDKYPHKSELSKARLTKMIYLSDWRMVLQGGRQVTNLKWQFNHYGPYLDDVKVIAASDDHFEVIETTNIYGSKKEVISLSRPVWDLALSPDERHAIDHVIDKTQSMYYQEFMKLVYSTFPIATQPRYEELDLVSLANQYKRNRAKGNK